jgi:spore maturation protein CgeB
MNYRSSRLRAAIAEWDPDLLLLIRGLGFRSWAFEGARRKFGWWVEADERVDEALKEVREFDHFFFINSTSVEAAKRAGYAHVSYLPHAVDASVFRPMPEVAKDLDFSFVGLWSAERQRYIEAALEVTTNGAVYGPKWLRKNPWNRDIRRIVKGSYIAGEDLVRLYNRSKVVINVTQWGAAGGAQRSGVTMRLFEVPATRTLLLTDSSVDIQLVITPGEHVATFADVDDFKAKLRFYLANAAERERIAAQGFEHVRAHRSYDFTAEKICQAYAACDSYSSAGGPESDPAGYGTSPPRS